jgi:hypothetical protein
MNFGIWGKTFGISDSSEWNVFSIMIPDTCLLSQEHPGYWGSMLTMSGWFAPAQRQTAPPIDWP